MPVIGKTSRKASEHVLLGKRIGKPAQQRARALMVCLQYIPVPKVVLPPLSVQPLNKTRTASWPVSKTLPPHHPIIPLDLHTSVMTDVTEIKTETQIINQHMLAQVMLQVVQPKTKRSETLYSQPV
jgi:hypothetical protein